VADAPWRCSQCGTVNEPNANACRSCGRWPSLFDLQQGTVDVDPPEEIEETFTRHAPLPEELELPVEATPAETRPPVEMEHEVSGVPEKPAEWPGPENPLDRIPKGWSGRLASWIVPILIVLYIVISAVVDR